MKCPICGLINPSEAQRCDCGYDFSTKTVKESLLRGGERVRTLIPKTPEEVKEINGKVNAYGIFFLASFFIGVVCYALGAEVLGKILGLVANIFFLLGLGALLERRSRNPWNVLFILTGIGWPLVIYLYCTGPKPLKK